MSDDRFEVIKERWRNSDLSPLDVPWLFTEISRLRGECVYLESDMRLMIAELEVERLRSMLGVADLIVAKAQAGDPEYVKDVAAFLAVCAAEYGKLLDE